MPVNPRRIAHTRGLASRPAEVAAGCRGPFPRTITGGALIVTSAFRAGRRSGEHCVLTGPLYQDTSSFLQSAPRTSVQPELCHKVVSSCTGGWESDYVVKEGKGRGAWEPAPAGHPRRTCFPQTPQLRPLSFGNLVLLSPLPSWSLMTTGNGLFNNLFVFRPVQWPRGTERPEYAFLRWTSVVWP